MALASVVMTCDSAPDRFNEWLAALEARHLADLRPPEVTRALRALSIDYVQRRHRVGTDALAGRGKRAAFALFYGPLHYLIVRDIAQGLGLSRIPSSRVLDLGCGSGAAGSAIATVMNTSPLVVGVDRQGWTLEEAAFTYRHFAVRHRTVRVDLRRFPIRPDANTLIVAAYTLNELDLEARAMALDRLRAALEQDAALLIVEPIARGITPWWTEWFGVLRSYGPRQNDWCFTGPLPEQLRRLDRAAGLNHCERKARSIWIPPRTP